MTAAALCAIALIGNLLPGCGPPASAIVGYVEGEYVAIAPIEVARIAAESVRRGDVLKAGDPVATLETTDAEIAVDNARSALAQAKSDLANIQYGRRPEEIAAIDAQLKAAEVQSDDDKRTLDRRRDLFNRGFAAQSDLDAAQTAYDVAFSRVGELTRQSRGRQTGGAPGGDRLGAAQGRPGAGNARFG